VLTYEPPLFGTLPRFLECSFDLEEAYDRVPREKRGVLREYDVDCRLSLVVKSLYFCSEVCARVGGGNHNCSLWVLDWIDSHSRVNESAVVGSCTCRINRLLFANGLVLLTSSEHGFQRDEGGTGRLIHGFVKQTRFRVSFIAL